ncbi:hypothetical protein ACOMHN_016456 [Nucella lapillus]
MVKEAAQSTLGPKKRVHQDWFDEKDEAITQLLDEKQKAYFAWQNDISSNSKRDHFKHIQHRAQTGLRRMQDEWWNKKADEVQVYADTKNSRMFFSALKAVYGPSRPSTTPLLSTNGALLKVKKAMNERWREHFSTLLNRHSTDSNEALDQIPQRPTLDSLDLPPSLEEVHKAIQLTSSGKAPGKDGIPAEFFKTVGPVALDTFHNLLCSIWEEEDMPQEFRDAPIISLFKNKARSADQPPFTLGDVNPESVSVQHADLGLEEGTLEGYASTDSNDGNEITTQAVTLTEHNAATDNTDGNENVVYSDAVSAALDSGTGHDLSMLLDACHQFKARFEEKSNSFYRLLQDFHVEKNKSKDTKTDEKEKPLDTS